MKDLRAHLLDAVEKHPHVQNNPSRKALIQATVDNGEAVVAKNGALATWNAPESTGRSPRDTFIVKRSQSEDTIDWTSANNKALSEEIFDMAFEDALSIIGEKKEIYVTDKVVGADSSYALPVKTVSAKALNQVFLDNMFRPVPNDIEKSVFFENGFTLLAVPDDKLDSEKYKNMLPAEMLVAVDMDRKLGLVIGSAYCGSCKKMLFTVMNYLLPFKGILPLHCSANEGKNGDSALLLGLSGTGKTTLSADPERALLGDDEHGWNEHGIANFEYGCYAKMININPAKEPEIYNAVMHQDDYTNHGAIIENAMLYPNGEFDFNDSRLTENSRASYPLHYLSNIKESSISNHPKAILFLTADAYGVLPPIAKLNKEQAMLWFLMGYTSKLAGTETGITEPRPSFSRFFGQPFMPCKPDVYADMLGEKMESHHTKAYLVNTGWSGGAYGIGKRMDINATRAMVAAVLSGDLENVEYIEDSIFHVSIPKNCPGVDSNILTPRNTWSDKGAYDQAANDLAKMFCDSFDKSYGDKNLSADIVMSCPGK